MAPVEKLRHVFEDRKAAEKALLSTHGEAGRYFVSFLGNHDQKQRFNHPASDPGQITLGYALMFGLQGIPSVYYGDEQGLDGTKDANGSPDLTSNESSREALWGKPGGFDTNAPVFLAIRDLSRCRREHPALRYGRLYFREVSGNGRDFGHSGGLGGVVAFSRILSDAEVLVVANTHTTERFTGFVLVDADLNRQPRRMSVSFSNRGTQGASTVRFVPDGRIFRGETVTAAGELAAVFVELAPMEVQVLA
jgi:glycosidase